jgi:hypothetical protein
MSYQITEEELLDLGWRAHVGGRIAKMELQITLSFLNSASRQARKAIDFLAMYGGGMVLGGSSRYADAMAMMQRERGVVVVHMETNYATIEQRILEMTANPLRAEELREVIARPKLATMDFPVLARLERERTHPMSIRETMRENKGSTRGQRHYRGPAPKRHK